KKVEYYLQDDIKKRNVSFASACYDSNSNRIITGTNNGIYLFDIKQHTSEFINQIHNSIIGFAENIKKINNNFIYSSDTAGHITVISGDFKSTYIVGSNNSSFETSISDPVCVDKRNRLWYCKSGFGLSILDFNQSAFSKESGYKEDPTYFSKRGTHSFAEYPNGDLLIKSGASLFSKNYITKEITQLKQYTWNISSTQLRNDYQRNGIWFFYNNKIILVDCKTNQIIYSVNCNENDYGIIQDIIVLPSGDVWIALTNGIYSIDFKKRKLEAVTNLQLPNAFKLNLINKNRVCISYLNGDMLLAQINSANNVSVVGKILPGTKCFYLQHDTIKNIFWTGADDGVYMLDKNFQVQRKFNASNGLSGSYVYGLLLDNNNNVWISHEKGLSCINSENFQVINYDEDDNIQDRDYNNRCFFKSKNGTLYFGGIKGFNWFKPPVSAASFYQSELYVDEIKVNNELVFADTNYNSVRHLNLSAQQNKISIHALIKDLDIVHSNEIIYRFKNLDSAWQYLPANSNIIFNNLAAGDYKLQLGYYNTKQQIHVVQKIITISIALPFYKTILFWMIVSACVTAIIAWWYNQTKIKNKTRRYQQQIALMKERNRITADLHDDVGSALSSLQIRSAIARQIMDDDATKAKEYLNKIIEQSNEISSNVSDIIWSMKPDKDRLTDIDGRIRNTVSNLLGATNIDYSMIIEKDLDAIVNNITARKNIVLIIKEATNNCAKYSQATKYNLLIEKEGDNLTIIIADNGKGIQEDKLKSGNGLQNMHKRAEELKGTMQIKTGNFEGTELKFNIPLTEIRG
ncbi:MAG: histidine kinase, partial [Parafilimonas sp.]